jgi:hypothetical protein
MEEIGLLNSVRHNMELKEFNAINEADRLKEALNWRDARFKKLDWVSVL